MFRFHPTFLLLSLAVMALLCGLVWSGHTETSPLHVSQSPSNRLSSDPPATPKVLQTITPANGEKNSTVISGKRRSGIISKLAKHTHMRPDQVEQVQSLLATFRKSKQKDYEKLKERQAHGAEFKVMREKVARQKQNKAKESVDNTIPSITEVNADMSEFLYQGDIMLSVEEAEQLASGKSVSVVGDGGNQTLPDWWHKMGSRGNKTDLPQKMKMQQQQQGSSSHRGKRQAFNPTTQPSRLWTNAFIPYTFDNTVSTTTKNLIRKALQYYYINTCLYFWEDTNNDYTNRLVYTTDADGCSSNVGRVSSTASQTVNIKAGGCEYVSTIVHESSHAAGFNHEMIRKDRDDWLVVLLNNVEVGKEHNFNPKLADNNGSNFGQPYDYGSVMHYNSRAFGKKDSNGNADQTLISMPFDTTYEWDQTMGTGGLMGPSMIDYKVMNALYNCPAGCASSPKTCYNGGFQNPNWCDQCVCPPGVGGDQCETPLASPIDQGYAPPDLTNTCTGGTKTVSSSGAWTTLSNTIGNTNWGLRADNDVAWCHWYLKAPAGYHLQIEVQSVGGRCGNGCPSGFLEVRVSTSASTADWGKTGRRICCASDLQAQPGRSTLLYNSVGRDAIISTFTRNQQRSFTLRYKAVPN